MSRLMTTLATAGALALGGCSFSTVFTDHAEDYNYTVEDTANRQLLTNILRARDERPLHFTALTQLRSSQSAAIDGAVGATISLGESAKTHTLAPRVGGNRQTSNSMDVAILDTQEFTRGLIKPIDVERVKYYMDREYNTRMLFFLFIDRIEETRSIIISKRRKNTTNDSNDPVKLGDALEDFRGSRVQKTVNTEVYRTMFNDLNGIKKNEFGEFVNKIDISKTRIIDVDKPSLLVGPKISPGTVTSLRDVAKFSEAGLRLEQIKSSSNMFQSTKSRDKELAYCVNNFSLTNARCEKEVVPTSDKSKECIARVYNLTNKLIEKSDKLLEEKFDNFSYYDCVYKADEAEETAFVDQDKSRRRSGQGFYSFGYPPPDFYNPSGQGRSAVVPPPFVFLSDDEEGPIGPDDVEQIAVHSYFHRSPEGMIKFLGRILRCVDSLAPPKPSDRVDCRGKVSVAPDDRYQRTTALPLFALVRKEKGAQIWGSTLEFGGVDYGVPDVPHERGYTPTVLALLNQLLAMQKKADELPKTQAVQSVGGL